MIVMMAFGWSCHLIPGTRMAVVGAVFDRTHGGGMAKPTNDPRRQKELINGNHLRITNESQ